MRAYGPGASGSLVQRRTGSITMVFAEGAKRPGARSPVLGGHITRKLLEGNQLYWKFTV